MSHILILLLICLGVAADAMAPSQCIGGPVPRRLLALQGHESAKAAARPVTGQLRAVALFARFAGEDSGSETLPSWTAAIFDRQRQGSLSHYYNEMSAGQFQLDGQVISQWFSSRQSASHYVADNPAGYARFGHFVTEILDAAANGGFITFRRDEHSQGIGGITQRASTCAEAVGTMAHEFGHALGLPDLVDASFGPDGEDDSAGIGYWGIMGHGNRGWQESGGPTPFCAWSLEQLGWIGEANTRLVTVDGRLQTAPLQDPRDGGNVYRLSSRGNSIYYLLEYRSPIDSYYDRHLPRAGVLIWQINGILAENSTINVSSSDFIEVSAMGHMSSNGRKCC